MNRGYLYIMLATLFFSSMEVALKTVAHDFHPMQLNCTRVLLGGLLLVPFALKSLKKKQETLTLKAWGGFAALGFVGLVVSMTLYQTSILYAPASVVSVLFSCNPVLVFVFAAFILKEAVKPQHITALVLEIAGAAVIIAPQASQLDLRGVTLVLLSAAAFALYAVLGKKNCARYSGLAVTCFSCLAASAEMLAIIALTHAGPVADTMRGLGLPLFAEIPFFSGYHSGNIPQVLYICVFVTAGGYACHFMGMEATSAMKGSLVFFFKPVLAPLLAMAVLGEVIPLNMWAGIGMILAASLISMLPSLHPLVAFRQLRGKPSQPPRRNG